MLQLLCENGYDTEVFYDPLAPDECIEHICVPEAGLSVITSVGYSNIIDGDAHIIDIDEIMDIHSCEKDYIHNRLMVENLVREASGIISKAKHRHDVLENYYIPCMDFESANKAAKRIIEDIRNNKIGVANI